MRIFFVVLALGVAVFAFVDRPAGVVICLASIVVLTIVVKKIHRHSRAAVILQELLITPIAPLSKPDQALSSVEATTRKDKLSEYELAAIAAKLIDKRPEMFGLEPSDERRVHLNRMIADFAIGQKIGFRARQLLDEV